MSLLDTIKKKIKKSPEVEKTAKAVFVSGIKGVKKQVKESIREETGARSGTPVQNKKYAYDVLTHPYITEKTSAMKAGDNKYVFIVAKSANKIELRKVIQEKYKVTVTKVNMINIPKKRMQMGRNKGVKTGFRKAIITLKKGDTIESGI